MKIIYGALPKGKESEGWKGKLEIQTTSPSKLSQGQKRNEKLTDCYSLLVAAP